MSVDLTNTIFHDEDAARAHLETALAEWSCLPALRRTTDVTKLEGEEHRAGLYQCNAMPAASSSRSRSAPSWSARISRSQVAAGHPSDGRIKKGICAKQIERMLGISYTAWFMMHRIREAMDGVT